MLDTTVSTEKVGFLFSGGDNLFQGREICQYSCDGELSVDKNGQKCTSLNH